MRGENHKVIVLLGDGECDEGQVWEAALTAAHRKLNNLVAIIDRNRLQLDGSTNSILNLEPLAEKWISFGWEVKEIDGHDLNAIVTTLESPNDTGKPLMVIANTVKGKGVSYMENKVGWHAGSPTDSELRLALQENA